MPEPTVLRTARLDQAGNWTDDYERRTWHRIRSRIICTTSGCWEWTGPLKDTGYARIHYRGKQRPAHRVVYQLLVGQIPDGLQIDHLCRNRACVNPRHMQPVTNLVNTLRGDGITAINARKTHCKRGHHLSGGNLNIQIWKGRPQRKCRICWLDKKKQWREEHQ